MKNVTDKEKIVNKFGEVDKIDTFQIKATEKELLFIDFYRKCGNATSAFLEVWPERGKNVSSARCSASNMVKKFNLKGKNSEWFNRQIQNSREDIESKIISHVKSMYIAGEIDENELFKRMSRLSSHAVSDQTRFVATKELRQWVREAKAEVEANKLSLMDIISLMINALSDLPKIKYIEVLKGARKKRMELIKERTIFFDPDKIRNEVKNKMISGGDFVCLNDKVI